MACPVITIKGTPQEQAKSSPVLWRAISHEGDGMESRSGFPKIFSSDSYCCGMVGAGRGTMSFPFHEFVAKPQVHEWAGALTRHWHELLSSKKKVWPEC